MPRIARRMTSLSFHHRVQWRHTESEGAPAMNWLKTSCASVALALGAVAACTSNVPSAATGLQQIAERTLIRELMDRYGSVHDSGTPEEYADLFTADGEIATGGRVL